MHAVEAGRKPPATIPVDRTITEAAEKMDRLAVEPSWSSMRATVRSAS
jgi:hypothetical protein